MNYISEAVSSQILFYLFVSVLIFATTQLVAVDESQNDHKIKPLLAKFTARKMFHNGWSVKNWIECAEFGMTKNSIFAVES
jgi:hypothetical protein